MKTLPLSDLILLPLAPTIVGTIADFLHSIARELYVNSLDNYDKIDTDLPLDVPKREYLGRNGTNTVHFITSIRQVPTLQYQYVSTIAHRLAARSVFTPVEICQKLQPSIPICAVNTCDRLELSCWYNDSGYIYFQIAPEAIAIWLKYIHDLPLDPCLDRDRSSASVNSVNIALYAHARCCSLLNLARTEKLVTITDNWQIGRSDRLRNHLICRENQLAAALKIVFEEPAEYRLIHALMAVLDGIYGDRELAVTTVGGVGVLGMGAESIASSRKISLQNSPNWTKLTIDLAASWLEFYRRCRIFGEIAHQQPHLAIARCELTAIARRYLQVLLENYLGVRAAIELEDLSDR